MATLASALLARDMSVEQAEEQQAMQAQQMQSLTDQAGQLASAPMLDPAKNPQAVENIGEAAAQLQTQLQ